MTSTAPVRCKCRKQAITGLRCSRCFVPICPDCSRPAAVGMLCNACARGKPSHLYQVDPRSFAIAIPVTLAAAIFGGWLMATIRGIGFFGMFIGYLYGMGIGEVALRLTGRKRGLAIEILSGTCVLLGLLAGYGLHFLIATSISGAVVGPPDPALIDVSNLALSFLMNPWIYVTIGVSIFGAVSRVRTIG